MKTLATLMMGPLLALASGQVTQAMIDEAAGNVQPVTVKKVVAALRHEPHQTLNVQVPVLSGYEITVVEAPLPSAKHGMASGHHGSMRISAAGCSGRARVFRGRRLFSGRFFGRRAFGCR